MVFLTRVRFMSNPIKKIYYNLQGYNKYGLYHDDFYNFTSDVHLEAIRRLPADVYDQHAFRLIRASQLEITKSELPESEQPTYEEDLEKGHFLTPYIDEVMREQNEKSEWLNFLSKN